MMRIFVNLQSLRSSSQEIQTYGSNVQKTGTFLTSAASRAPSYEGQFGPWVQSIAAEANARSKQSSSSLLDIGLRVGRKAQQFAAVDQAAVGAGLRLTRAVSLIIGTGNLWRWLPIIGGGKFWDTIRRLFPWLRWFPWLWRLPWFLIPGAILRPPWRVPPVRPPMPPVIPKPEVAPPGSPSAPSDSELWRREIKSDGPTPGANTKFPHYNGQQQCTNYVAQKRNVDGFRVAGDMNGKRWAVHAEANGYLVSEVPAKGTIMVFNPDAMVNPKTGSAGGFPTVYTPGVEAIDPAWGGYQASAQYGHVAYVESVKFDGQFYEVEISQANAGADKMILRLDPSQMQGVSFIHDKQ